MTPILEAFASGHHLYLDTQGERACRKGVKCTWTDSSGNAHDLDFVVERGGTRDRIGTPVAFIESAWRRYTKHSRNKAQEIQGAIVPLADTYKYAAPFKGAILAGVFTPGAVKQMRSLGFTILYFPYKMILAAFARFGIDASFQESTPDSTLRRKLKQYNRLTSRQRAELPRELIRLNSVQVEEFVKALTIAISRRIERVAVLPLHGVGRELTTLDEAIAFIANYDECNAPMQLQRYEIQIRYSNGDAIDARFVAKSDAIAFLDGYRPR